jgi:peptidoglycan/xylan/chitin deacetylase (PgdA/CDA1 family)
MVTSVRRYYPSTPRSIARRAGLWGLALAGSISGATRRALARPRVQILLFHHLFEDERPGFRALLADLARDHELVTYGEALRRVMRGGGTKPAVAISFDDGRSSCMQAAEELERFGARGCFFVCPGVVGERRYAGVKSFCEERLHFPATPLLNWRDLELLRDRGHEIGNHTLDHVDLGAVPAGVAAAQIVEARRLLASRLGECRHFAWPYGLRRNITSEAVRCVFESGHESCASAVRGAHEGAASTPRLILHRDNCVAAWPVAHLRWLLARNVRSMRAGKNVGIEMTESGL